jgi:hypothetical protein
MTAPIIINQDTTSPTPSYTPGMQFLPIAPVQFDTHETLSILVHAGSKVGKSTLASSAPIPILVLDAEGSWKFIPVRKKFWEPAQGPPPQYDGTWDVCIVNVREWETVRQVYAWLTQAPNQFTSLVVDSITEIQRRCKSNLKGTEALRIQDWGVLLAVMDAVIRGFRDLTLMPHLPLRCVIFVAETKENQAGKWVPFMQGQIAVAFPYWVDLCGYLFPNNLPDANGQPTQEVRQLLISPHPQFEAGERVQGRLGKVVTIFKPPDGQVGRDVEQMMLRIYGPRPERTTAP